MDKDFKGRIVGFCYWCKKPIKAGITEMTQITDKEGRVLEVCWKCYEKWEGYDG